MSNIAELEIKKILQPFVPAVAKQLGKDLNLDRMLPVLKLIGSPHEKLRVIHVAGTSGKTSTCYYSAFILHFTGKNVGLTVSPHVNSITERVQINGQPIDAKVFLLELKEFIKVIQDLKNQPSYFELLLAFSLWMFVKHKVDYAVIETGLGGLFDASNVITRQDKVCVITDIGYDHMHVLGSTLASITRQKAGIIQARNYICMYTQSSEVMTQVYNQVEKINGKLEELDFATLKNKSVIDLDGLPLFQQRNWLLAYAAASHVAKRDGFELQASINPKDVVVPGRMEIKHLADGTKVILDGAHNKQKITAFVESYKNIYGNQKASIVLSLKSGKEYKEVIDSLLDISETIIVTSFHASQDTPIKSQKSEDLFDYCRMKNIPCEIVDNPIQAVAKLLAKDTSIKLVVGSFYLLGQIRYTIKS